VENLRKYLNTESNIKVLTIIGSWIKAIFSTFEFEGLEFIELGFRNFTEHRNLEL
jgi:hypothetical protein